MVNSIRQKSGIEFLIPFFYAFLPNPSPALLLASYKEHYKIQG